MLAASAGLAVISGMVVASATGNTTADVPAGEIMPVVGYSPFWLVLGITLLGVIVAFYLAVALFTRSRSRKPKATAPPPPPVDVAMLQVEANERVDEVQRQVLTGALDPRSANEELSSIVRGYVAELTGIPADHMTLDEIRAAGLAGTTSAVEQFYPAIFAVESDSNVTTSVVRARRVLNGWR